ncbi:MAG: hypothetical protein DLM55_03480 [Acidimicrobiales bacterium]|nr:MAG: hypothetical protein DLM55_03480 [Acidimicrobiales bacterium]
MTSSYPWQESAASGAVSPPGGQRWNRLFTDLESELTAVEDAEFAAEVADRTRRELATVRLVDRLRAAIGSELVVTVDSAGPSTVSGVLRDVGADWALLATAAGNQLGARVLLPLAAVMTLRGLPFAAAAPGSEGHVAARYDMRMVLRRLMRDRAVLTLVLRSGDAVLGRLDRVGADCMDVTTQESGERRVPRSPRHAQTIPCAALALVRLE